MPGYMQGQSQLLRANRQFFFWNGETVTAATLSAAVQLERLPGPLFYPWGFSVEIWFSGNPGSFEIDVMGANNDVAANYLPLGSITTASGSTVTGAFVARYDMASNLWPKYVALYLKTLTNSVQVTAQGTR